MGTSRGERALQNLRLPRVYHPPLFALVPLLGLYAQNAPITPVSSLVRPAIVLSMGAIALWLVVWAIVRQRYRAGLIASTLVVSAVVLWGVLEDTIRFVVPLMEWLPPASLYGATGLVILAVLAGLSYRTREDPAKRKRTLRTAIVVIALCLLVAAGWWAPVLGRRAAWLVMVYVLATALAVIRLARLEGDLVAATRSVNWFATILLGLYGVVILINQAPAPTTPRPLEIPEAAATVAQANDPLPDIYFVALEGYARSDVLRNVFSYSNLPFEETMTALGFKVVRESRSNYPNGILSLTAALNLDYLDELVEDAKRQDGTMRDVYGLYHNNRMFAELRRRGYSLHAFSPGLESLEPRGEAVTVLAPRDALGEFELVLLDRTIFTRIMESIYHFRYKNPAYWHFEPRRRRILFAFDEMARLAGENEPRPRFVFAHLLIPEPPFLFTREGDRAQPFGPGSLAIHTAFRGKELEFSRAYIDQVHFTNDMLARTARAVIQRSKRPVVFIIASTSGLPITSGREGQVTPDRFATMLLVRLPEHDGGDPRQLDDSMTLVNLFRLVLDELFGTGLGPRPDRTLVSVENRPFQSAPAASSRIEETRERSATLVPTAGQVDNGP